MHIVNYFTMNELYWLHTYPLNSYAHCTGYGLNIYTLNSYVHCNRNGLNEDQQTIFAGKTQDNPSLH